MNEQITFILGNVPMLLATGKTGFDLIASVRAAAQTTGEWADDNETALQAALTAANVDPTWQLDAPPEPDLPENPAALQYGGQFYGQW